MRIISGRLRGKRIAAPTSLPSRPTTDRAKESLFHLVTNRLDLEEIKALDLFAGTGNISYELASRGCSDLLCVDREKACVDFIRKTADQLGFVGLRTLRTDALDFAQKTAERFDFIFADPPFDYEQHEALALTIMDRNRLFPGGVLILEHSVDTDLSSVVGFVEIRKYGSVCFSIFETEDDAE
ncbi:methyltransferase domain-containing protein [bacterium]|nr:methyltransferase domain-containing protein [bacterium]